jgi:hypothetical protein
MANHNLQKAQRLFTQLMENDVPYARVEDHVGQIMLKLNHAHTVKSGEGPETFPDVAALVPGKTTQEVQSMLDAAIAHAEKHIYTASARYLVDRMEAEGKTTYTPEQQHVYDHFKIPGVFKRAGIDTSLFDNGGTPPLEAMKNLVDAAEAALRREDAIKASQGVSKQRA